MLQIIGTLKIQLKEQWLINIWIGIILSLDKDLDSISLRNSLCLLCWVRRQQLKNWHFNKLTKKDHLILLRVWLTEHKFLCGDEISIADISAACEMI